MTRFDVSTDLTAEAASQRERDRAARAKRAAEIRAEQAAEREKARRQPTTVAMLMPDGTPANVNRWDVEARKRAGWTLVDA